MSLLDEARDAQSGSGSQCGVAKVREASDASSLDDLDELLEAVAAKAIYASTATAVLKLHGIALSAATLNRHRRQQCGCH